MITTFPFPHLSHRFDELIVSFHAYLYVYILFPLLKILFSFFSTWRALPLPPMSSLNVVSPTWFSGVFQGTPYCFTHHMLWVWFFQFMRALKRQTQGLAHVALLANTISELIPSHYMLILIFIVISSTLFHFMLSMILQSITPQMLFPYNR